MISSFFVCKVSGIMSFRPLPLCIELFLWRLRAQKRKTDFYDKFDVKVLETCTLTENYENSDSLASRRLEKVWSPADPALIWISNRLIGLRGIKRLTHTNGPDLILVLWHTLEPRRLPARTILFSNTFTGTPTSLNACVLSLAQYLKRDRFLLH